MTQDPLSKRYKSLLHGVESQCPHLHTTMLGGMHFINGDVWDDLVEVCTDCGANLDELALQQILSIEIGDSEEMMP